MRTKLASALVERWAIQLVLRLALVSANEWEHKLVTELVVKLVEELECELVEKLATLLAGVLVMEKERVLGLEMELV